MQATNRPTVPTTAIVNVTPDQALAWLEQHNGHNRNIRSARVGAYARDMTNGKWQFNGDPIRFSAEGVLLDGQHRLSAVARSGVTLPFLVVWGLPDSTQETMDIGAHRTLADALTLRGEGNSGFLAAVARRVVGYDSGFRVQSSENAPTHAEMAAYIDTHPELRRSVEVALRSRQAGLPVAPSVIGAAHEICARLSKDDAETFYMSQLIDGLNLQAKDPARVLRYRLQQEAAGGRQMAPDNAFRYVLMAWNHFRSRNQITKLQAPHGGWTPKNFPIPR